MSLFRALTTEELAIAVGSALAIMNEMLIANGVDALAIEDMAEAKADELMDANQYHAAGFLRAVLGRRLD